MTWIAYWPEWHFSGQSGITTSGLTLNMHLLKSTKCTFLVGLGFIYKHKMYFQVNTHLGQSVLFCFVHILTECSWTAVQKIDSMGGGPGQVVMGGDSCSKGCEFESRHCILDGHLFTFICCKNYNLCVWKDENTWRRGRGWPIFVKWIKFFLAKEVWRQRICF